MTAIVMVDGLINTITQSKKGSSWPLSMLMFAIWIHGHRYNFFLRQVLNLNITMPMHVISTIASMPVLSNVRMFFNVFINILLTNIQFLSIYIYFYEYICKKYFMEAIVASSFNMGNNIFVKNLSRTIATKKYNENNVNHVKSYTNYGFHELFRLEQKKSNLFLKLNSVMEMHFKTKSTSLRKMLIKS